LVLQEFWVFMGCMRLYRDKKVVRIVFVPRFRALTSIFELKNITACRSRSNSSLTPLDTQDPTQMKTASTSSQVLQKDIP
jgi:hypothetical protein